MSRFSSSFGSSNKQHKSLPSSPLDTKVPNTNHLVIDITSGSAVTALESLLALPSLSHKVKTATVHADSLLNKCGSIILQKSRLENCLLSLGALPRLKEVTLALNYTILNFPLSAITKLLAKSKSLKKLHLRHFHLKGSDKDVKELKKAASSCKQLEILTLDFIKGPKEVQTLIINLTSLQELYTINTSIQMSAKTLSGLKLKRLHLEDSPDLNDDSCPQLAQALAQNNSLQSFTLSSTMITNTSAKAMCRMLLTNNTLTEVAFYMDSEKLPNYMASVIRENKHLEKIHIKIPDHPNHGCLPLADALTKNNTLQDLRLRIEIELDAFPTQCIHAFDTAISNSISNLGSFTIEDGTSRYPLSENMKHQLQLNRTGVKRLLQKEEPASLQEQLQTLSQTLLQNEKDDNLSATFYLLQNSPELIYSAIQKDASSIATASGTISHPTKKFHMHGIRRIRSYRSNSTTSSSNASSTNTSNNTTSSSKKIFGGRMTLPTNILKRTKAQVVNATMVRST